MPTSSGAAVVPEFQRYVDRGSAPKAHFHSYHILLEEVQLLSQIVPVQRY